MDPATQALRRLWTPMHLRGRLTGRFWFDAQTMASLAFSASKVNTWIDRYNGVLATQSTDALRPVYSAAGINGKPALTPGGGEDLVLASLPGGSLQTAFTNGSDSTVGFSQVSAAAQNGSSTATGMVGVSRMTVMAWRPGSYWIYVDGTLIGSGASSAGASPDDSGLYWAVTNLASSGAFGFGRWYDAEGGTAHLLNRANPADQGRGLNGALGEQGCVSGPWGREDIDRLFGYMAHRWAMPRNLPAGARFRAAPPTLGLC